MPRDNGAAISPTANVADISHLQGRLLLAVAESALLSTTLLSLLVAKEKVNKEELLADVGAQQATLIGITDELRAALGRTGG